MALNTEFGAIAADVTAAEAILSDAYSSSGESVRISYSKLVHRTQTSFVVSTYRYSSSGFYSFSDAQSRGGGGGRRCESRHGGSCA